MKRILKKIGNQYEILFLTQIKHANILETDESRALVSIVASYCKDWLDKRQRWLQWQTLCKFQICDQYQTNM